MEITQLSNKGQINIPKKLIEKSNWKEGQEFIIINVGDGILLKPKKLFPKTKLDDVAGCLNYQQKAKTLEEMEQAIAQEIKESWNQ